MSETTQPASLPEAGAPGLRNWRDWVGLVARLIPGIVFVYAGITKIVNIPWFIRSIEAYQIPFLQAPFSDILGHVLPIVEIIAGLLLVVGLLTRGSAAAILLMLLAFMGGIVWVWSQGISIDCGCFGSGGEVAPEDTNYPMKLLENLGMSLLCGWLLYRPRSLFSLDHLLFNAPLKGASFDEFDEADAPVADPATKE